MVLNEIPVEYAIGVLALVVVVCFGITLFCMSIWMAKITQDIQEHGAMLYRLMKFEKSAEQKHSIQMTQLHSKMSENHIDMVRTFEQMVPKHGFAGFEARLDEHILLLTTYISLLRSVSEEQKRR